MYLGQEHHIPGAHPVRSAQVLSRKQTLGGQPITMPALLMLASQFSITKSLNNAILNAVISGYGRVPQSNYLTATNLAADRQRPLVMILNYAEKNARFLCQFVVII